MEDQQIKTFPIHIVTGHDGERLRGVLTINQLTASEHDAPHGWHAFVWDPTQPLGAVYCLAAEKIAEIRFEAEIDFLRVAGGSWTEVSGDAGADVTGAAAAPDGTS